MNRTVLRKAAFVIAIFASVWVFFRYFLPLILPFLLGWLLAKLSEPAASFLSEKIKFPRPAASLVSVSGMIILFFGLLLILGSILFRELSLLGGILPEIESSALQAVRSLEDFLLNLVQKAPDGIQPSLKHTVFSLFSSGTVWMERLAGQIPRFLSRILEVLPGSAIALGTGLLSAFMFSARLPDIRKKLLSFFPGSLREKYIPVLEKARKSLRQWLKAQLKLSSATFLIVLTGLGLAGIPGFWLWAAGITLIDAIPMLGTGIILVPWAVLSVLQKNWFRGLFLLGTFAAASLTRSALEPRLVGKQLGLDPLLTLISLYIGYRLWGVAGMLLAPVLTAVSVEIAGNSRRTY